MEVYRENVTRWSAMTPEQQRIAKLPKKQREEALKTAGVAGRIAPVVHHNGHNGTSAVVGTIPNGRDVVEDNPNGAGI
jgi:hypothetical protein